MEIDRLQRNIQSIAARVSRAAEQSGNAVTVVAATKTVPPDVINLALSLGITDVGENRVQEYLDKRDAVQTAKWHFIGTLQSNKAKYLVGNVSLIQSVNSKSLASEINRLAVKHGVKQRVLIEVNAAGEDCKTGAPIETAEELADYAHTLGNLEVCGLMSVPPIGAGDGVYMRLCKLYELLRKSHRGFDILSVGMSGDFERAIANGSNMVRIGSAIFGARIYKG